MRRVKFLAIVIASCVVLGVGAFQLMKYWGGGTSDEAPIYVADLASSRVFIKDLHKYNQYFAPERHIYIEQALHTYVMRSGAEPDLFTGVVREGSLTHSKVNNGNTANKLFIDIYPANITYSLAVESGENLTDIRPITIECVPPRDQLDHTANCVSGYELE